MLNRMYNLTGKRAISLLVILFMAFSVGQAFSQKDTTEKVKAPADQKAAKPAEKSGSDQKAAPTTGKAAIELKVSYVKSNDSRSVKVHVSRKENKKSVGCDSVSVSLYFDEVKAKEANDITGLLATLVTDENGDAEFKLTDKFNKAIADRWKYTFIASIENDKRYKNAEEEVTISDASITLTFDLKDSVKTVTAKLSGRNDTTADLPINKASVKFYVKRSFSLLPIGADGLSTNKKGIVTAEIPNDIMADTNGKITVIARIEEHAKFATVEGRKDIEWKTPRIASEVQGRSLWSVGKNAPVPLVVGSCFIVFLVWGVIFYLFYQLIRIKKLSKTKAG